MPGNCAPGPQTGGAAPLPTGAAELLARRLQAATAAPALVIPRLPAAAAAPLSYGQERLWFLEQLEPNSTAYRAQKAVRLTGALDPAHVAIALTAILARHEALRAGFVSVDGAPVRRLRPPGPVNPPVESVEHLPETQRETEALRLGVANGLLPFALDRGELARPLLVRLSPADHILFWAVHHIAFDDWSTGVLVRELAEALAALRRGEEPALAELPIQYGDYAAWQRREMSGPTAERQLYFWRGQLAGELPVLELATDLPRPATPSSRGAEERRLVPLVEAEQLHAIGRAQRATLFMVLMAAYHVLLMRYTGQENIVVGLPVAGRRHLETEGLIGFFINSLPLRVDLTGNPTFQDLLAQVRGTALQVYEHQDLPFERLVNEIQPQRNLSRSPIFQTSLQVRNVPRQRHDLPGLTVEEFTYDPETARLELALGITERAAGLDVVATYPTDLFLPDTIGRLCGHYHTLLRGIIAAPQARVWDLPLMTAAERHQVLVTWNETTVDLHRSGFVPEMFASQARRRPEQAAAEYEGQTLTYAELDQLANQLAHHLQGLGVTPGAVVAMALPRSLEYVVSMLGILRAGAVFLPLDPQWPAERLAFMLQDAGPRAIIVGEVQPAVFAAHGCPLAPLDSTWTQIAAESHLPPPVAVDGEDLAYIIYTSGSTGQPKGVMVTHLNIAEHCLATAHRFGLDEDDCVLQFMATTFDPSVEQVLMPLIIGARVLLPDTRSWLISDYLPRLVAHGVTHLHVPSPFWNQLADEWTRIPERLGELGLRRVVVGADVMSPATLHKWRQLPLDPVPLYNAYGPTETTVRATAALLPPELGKPAPVLRPPIGTPLPNRRVYVLDPHGRPAPVGVPGELHIGGSGVARGYLNRPELTAERFIPDRFSDVPGARLYRSGDRVRFLADGNLDIIERLDQQVKIRGFRVELGEVEAALLGHSAIRQAAATAVGEAGVDRILTAYLVCAPGEAPTVTQLRQFLAETLPDYAVPSAFVFLPALPLNASGKVDRKALPAPRQVRPELDAGFVAARGPVAEMVAKVFGEVLQMAQIGAEDSFFDLGGYSLAAVRVISRLRDASGVDLPLRAIFEAPTVTALAARLGEIMVAATAEADLAALLDELEAPAEGLD